MHAATLAQIRAHVDWVWLHCGSTACLRSEAVRLDPIIEKVGADVSSDVVRRNAVCRACGHKGAEIRLPSWKGSQIGFAPFPGHEKAPEALGLRG